MPTLPPRNANIPDPLSSVECNGHLLVSVLDSALVTLVLEMGTKTGASAIDDAPSAVRTRSRTLQADTSNESLREFDLKNSYSRFVSTHQTWELKMNRYELLQRTGYP